jgi:flagellar motor switch protein FliN/FliY
MPDPFGDNEALSQDALDALINSVGDAEAAFSSESEPSAEVNLPDMSALGSDDESETESPAFGDEGPLPGSMAAQPSSKSPLHMASFDTPAAEIPSAPKQLQGFERVQDIPLELTVELGRTRLLIKDILDLRAGSIVELEKMAGEPVDILANGLLVARGEVVVIEDAFGVRITEIITSLERKALTDDQSMANAA